MLHRQNIKPEGLQGRQSKIKSICFSNAKQKASIEDKNEITKQVIWLWLQLETIYPTRWLSGVGDAVLSSGEINKTGWVWVKAISQYSQADIKQALEWLPLQHKSWALPNLGDLLRLCEQAKNKRLQNEEYQQFQIEKKQRKPRRVTRGKQIKILESQIQAFTAVGMNSKVGELQAELSRLINK